MPDAGRFAQFDADFKSLDKAKAPVGVTPSQPTDRFAAMDADFKAVSSPKAVAKPQAPVRESALPTPTDEKPSLLRQFFTPLSTQPRGTGFGEDAMIGAAELGLGAGTAAQKAASSLPGNVGTRIGAATQPTADKMKNASMGLHELAKGSLGEGVGYYGPLAALTPAMSAAGTGAVTNVAGNVLDATKDDRERYGLIDNAGQAVAGGVLGKGGEMLVKEAPAIAKGAWDAVKGFPARVREAGSVGGGVASGVKDTAAAGGSGLLKGFAKLVGGVKDAGAPAKLASLTPAEKVVARTAEASGYSTKEANQLAKDAREHGINLPLFGILDDPNLTRYAQAIGSFSGGAKQASMLIKDIKTNQVPQAIEKAIQGIGDQKGITPLQSGTALTSLVNDVYKAKQQELVRAARPFYDELRKEAFPESTYKAYLAQPEVKQAVQDVLKLYGEDTPGYPGLKSLVKQPSTEFPRQMSAAEYQAFIKGEINKEPDYNNLAIWNEVKKRLGAAGRAEQDPYRKARLFDLSSMISDGLKEHSPNYQKAIAVYEEDAKGGEVRQMQDSIYKTLRELHSDRADKAMAKVFSYPPEVISKLRKMMTDSKNPAAKDIWNNAMAGFMTEVFDNARKTNPFEFSKQLFGDPKVQQQLKAALPEHYDGLKKMFGVLEKTQETLQKLPTSLTAPLQQAQKELGHEMGGTAIDLATSRKGWTDLALDAVRNAYLKNVVQNKEGAEQLARLLFSDEGLELLNKIENAPPQYVPAVVSTFLERVGSVAAPAYLKHLWNTNLEGQQ